MRAGGAGGWDGREGMILLGVSLLALALDQASKLCVMHRLRLEESVAVIPGFLNITYIHNPGAAFGFLSGMPGAVRIPFFLAVTVAAGFIVYAYQRLLPRERWWPRFSLGLICGGAMGNFVDRMAYGRVVDFIDVYHRAYHFWVFNVADSCITVGITLLILDYLFGPSRAEGL